MTEGDPEATPAVEAAGYRVVRRGAEMVRDTLDQSLPDHPVAAGFELRPVPPEGIHVFWEVTTTVFADTFGAGGQDAFAAWRDDPSRDPSLDAELRGMAIRVAAYVLNRRCAHGSPRGELHEVGTVGVPSARPRRRPRRAVCACSATAARAAPTWASTSIPTEALTLYGMRAASASRTRPSPIAGRSSPWSVAQESRT